MSSKAKTLSRDRAAGALAKIASRADFIGPLQVTGQIDLFDLAGRKPLRRMDPLPAVSVNPQRALVAACAGFIGS